MILTAHQPNYLPYLGFFHKAATADVFAIWDTVQFVKGGPFGWQCRNKIRTKDGWTWLSVPMLSKGRYKQLISEAHINNDAPWRRKHWRSIYLNYKDALYFMKYSDFFEELYKREWDRLVDISEVIIRYLMEVLGIKPKVIKCSDLGLHSQGTDLIIDVCKKIGADTFLSGKHGKDYLDEEKLRNNNIRLMYQDFTHPRYKQLYEPFVENLSVIDLLCNEGDASLSILMGKTRGQ